MINGLYQLNLNIVKESRSYFMQFPVGAPYEEAAAVAHEFAEAILEYQRRLVEESEKHQLKEEITNMQEAAKVE